MPANKIKAQRFVDEVSAFARKKREELEIDRNDVDLLLRVKVVDTVAYSEHEDED